MKKNTDFKQDGEDDPHSIPLTEIIMKKNTDFKQDGEDDPHSIPLTINVEEKDEKLMDEHKQEKTESMIKIIFSGKLPKSFGLIIGNEFCERFCFYGLRAILTLYLIEFLGQSNVTATNVYHVFTLFAYFLPIFGAIISDSWLGKFKTILILSIVYAIGTTLMSILAIPSVGNRNLAGVIVALMIIAIGTGGIKPCVSSFGADQFQGETQYLECFFNAFYMSINAGSVLSMIITPLIRGVQCLQPEDDPQCENINCECYALAFGIPAILMVVAILFFVAGTKIYIKIPPQGSVLLKFVLSIYSAIKNKITKTKVRREVNHWLDNASEDYDLTSLDDFKQVLSVIKLFAPLCFFWTLYDQTGSTWVIQGRMMFHKIGNWNLTPDLIQAVNPILVLILVPLFDSLLYPFLARFKFLVKSLHRMVAGMLFAALAFFVAGFIQIAVINDIRAQNSTNVSTHASSYDAFQSYHPNIYPQMINAREDIQQSSIHILFQLIQYFLLTSGEVLFSISGLHFAYAEAPQSMKSVMTAIWLLTNSIGNLITVIINSIVGDRSDEIWLFFLYAVLIVVVDGLFVLLVRGYVPREQRLKDTEVMLSELQTKLKAESQQDDDN